MATVSKVSICNSALSKLGAERITSLTEDSRTASACNEQFDKLRDEVLAAHPWNFATKRASLAQTSTTPEFDYDLEYQLPSDCLRVIGTNNDYDDPWVVENGKLLTNATEVKIKYIFRNEDVHTYSPNFQEALALRIAADLAYNINQSVTQVELLTNMYERFIKKCRSFDAQEGTPQAYAVDTWTSKRL